MIILDSPHDLELPCLKQNLAVQLIADLEIHRQDSVARLLVHGFLLKHTCLFTHYPFWLVKTPERFIGTSNVSRRVSDTYHSPSESQSIRCQLREPTVTATSNSLKGQPTRCTLRTPIVQAKSTLLRGQSIQNIISRYNLTFPTAISGPRSMLLQSVVRRLHSGSIVASSATKLHSLMNMAIHHPWTRSERDVASVKTQA